VIDFEVELWLWAPAGAFRDEGPVAAAAADGDPAASGADVDNQHYAGRLHMGTSARTRLFVERRAYQRGEALPLELRGSWPPSSGWKPTIVPTHVSLHLGAGDA
jgi:hypothetical protein